MGRHFKGDCPLFNGYSRTGNINIPLFAKLAKKIKGNRSQKNFALACDYSTSGISQLLNGKMKNIELDFAQAIWDSREENCPVSEEEFLAAFGFTKNLSAEQSDESFSKYKRQSLEIQPLQTSDSNRNICQNALLAHKYPILETKINYLLDNNLDKKIIIDFSIQTKTLEEKVIEWIVKIVPNSITDARNFFDNLFAILYVQGSGATIMRYSVVVSDRKIFKTLKGVYQDVQVDDYISIILIDNKRQAVADEFIMPRRNTQDDVQSIFT